mgnify:CR=1 FL=1
MRALFLSLGAASVALATATLPANAAASGDLAKVEAHIDAVKSMTANFSQTDRSGQVQSGKMMLKRPGQVRFEYGKNTNMLIVADGKSLNMIDYDVKQVQRWPIGNHPLSALLDPKHDLSKFGKIVPSGNSNVVTVAVKDPKRPEYGTISMVFTRSASAPAGLALYSWVALDSQNNRTTVKLSNVRYNVSVPASAFTWKDPRGGPGPR